MKVFHCDHCDHLLFFENTRCVGCGHVLAFLPDLEVVGSLDHADGVFTSPLPRAKGRRYRLCANYTDHDVCNWALAADDPDALCPSCRLTRVIPDLAVEANKAAWYKLEVAKRRLVYTLLQLGLSVGGLAFEFLADPATTGHAGGVITVNVAEADDAERERRRLNLNEPYRTLLGHFRHETGHYYWDRLIAGGPRLEAFRALFGDERRDYGEALRAHYANGPAADWQARYVSAYASVHPWEDWAESWAHYLHMADTLQSAAGAGLSLRPARADEPALKATPAPQTATGRLRPFDQLLEAWYPLTYLLNNLNRGLGLPDGYPFVLSPAAVEKLRFVHETVAAATLGERGA